MVNVSQSSGNSIRDWVHCEGSYTPMFNSNGYVTGTDKDGTLIEDMRKYIFYFGLKNLQKERILFLTF